MKAVSLVMLLFIIFSSVTVCFAESEPYPGREELVLLAEGIIEWKSKSLSSDNKDLYTKLSANAGSTASDWYAFALGRFGILDGAGYYTDHLKLYTEQKYSEKDKLSPYLSTEWHRIAITALSLGSDAKNFGKDMQGNNIDLINDGVYNRGLEADLGSQGISGYIWGLITLDTKRYDVPAKAVMTRENIITEILKRQLPDGGFAIAGKVSDPDVTSMAIIALSAYINESKIYEYINTASNEKKNVSVRDVIKEAVSALSKMQTDSGEFRSYGQANVKSACQVAVALCSVGIDIFKDERFIKNGEDILDVILRYRNTDGGFLNYMNDSGESNSMSGEQVLYTLNAILRFIENERKLFDLRPEFSSNMKERIIAIRDGISALSASSAYDTVYSLVKQYCSLPKNERDYIYGFEVLTERASSLGIDIEKTDEETEKIPDESDANIPGEEENVLSEEDVSFIRSISVNLPDSTESYQRLLILKRKISDIADIDEKEEMMQIVSRAAEHIESIQRKIDSINKGIADIAYPLDGVNKSDKDAIYALMKDYESLSLYDKSKVEDYEGLLAAYAKADSDERSGNILFAAVILIVHLVIIVVIRIRARRRKKREEMYCE